MNKLLQQVMRQRELKVELDPRLSVTARRPTDLQMTELQRSGSFGDLGQKYVVGWAGFTENDLVGGGGSDAVPFDVELWADYYADHPEYWEKIAVAILDAYHLHVKSSDETAKNLQPG